MRTYEATAQKTAKNSLPKRLILGLVWIAFLAFSLPAVDAQDMPKDMEIPLAIPEESPAQASAAPVSLPDAVQEIAPPIAQGQDSEPGLFLPLAREGTGAESWYYEAKRLEQSLGSEMPDEKAQALLDAMYSLAFHFGEKTTAIEAGRTLLQRSLSRASYPGAKTLALQWLEYFGPDWEVYRILISRALESADYAQVLEAVAAMKRLLPSTAKASAAELLFYEFSARGGLGEEDWLPAALAYLDAATLDSWGAKVLRLAAATGSLEPETRDLCLMRANFQAKEYGQAAALALAADRRLHQTDTKRFLISEAGRAFVSSGMKAEGIGFFLDYFPIDSSLGEANIAEPDPIDLPEAVLISLGSSGSPENLWVAAYYLARLWQSADKEREAAILFLGLTDSAPSSGDADGALWYWLDITMRRIAQGDSEELGAGRSLEFGALVEISRRWRNAASFDDIVDDFARRLLREKSWSDLYSLYILLDDRLSASMRTRLSYVSGRLLEEGLAAAGSGVAEAYAIARRQYESILADEDAEEYYRTMSAWRLGLEPPFLASMPALPDNNQGDGADRTFPRPETILEAGYAPSDAIASAGAGFQTALSLIKNYLTYELDEMASAVALRYLGSLDVSLLASLAFDLSAEGQHNAALRLARDAVYRGAGQRYPELYGLVYPKAWNDIVSAAASIPGIPDALAYGIIRSESVFDPKAVSYAGAIGLSQLMPGTAAETARGLKMNSYSLIDPQDNVTIGMTYYSYMLDRFGKKPMRAMFAYNAGPGRMTAWNKESGELPDDILLEALHLAQPRQYAKNIIQASLAYGKIHYDIDALSLLDYLVQAKPLSPKAKESTAEQAAETAASEQQPSEEILPLHGITQ
jgi:soluble lytic murein transglycosylase-like protein